MKNRYVAIKKGSNTWCVFDNKRNCTILKTVSSNANYNQEACQEAVDALNQDKPQTQQR